jgi:hypothetical protein
VPLRRTQLERYPPGTQMPQFLDRLREIFDKLHNLADQRLSWIRRPSLWGAFLAKGHYNCAMNSPVEAGRIGT